LYSPTPIYVDQSLNPIQRLLPIIPSFQTSTYNPCVGTVRKPEISDNWCDCSVGTEFTALEHRGNRVRCEQGWLSIKAESGNVLLEQLPPTNPASGGGGWSWELTSWERENGGGGADQFKDYEPARAASLEKAFQQWRARQGPAKVSTVQGKKSYMIDFDAMTQTNVASNFTRAIQRKPPPAMARAHPVRPVLPTPAAQAAPQTASRATAAPTVPAVPRSPQFPDSRATQVLPGPRAAAPAVPAVLRSPHAPAPKSPLSPVANKDRMLQALQQRRAAEAAKAKSPLAAQAGARAPPAAAAAHGGILAAPPQLMAATLYMVKGRAVSFWRVALVAHGQVGLGGIVVSEIEAPIILVNLV
jgi:hypothetical protein